MPRSALVLAALVSAALPTADPVSARLLSTGTPSAPPPTDTGADQHGRADGAPAADVRKPGDQDPAAKTAAAHIPDAQTPDAQTPAAQTPTAQTPATQTPDAKAPYARAPDATTPAAEAPAPEAAAGDVDAVDVAVVTGADGRDWEVRAPRSAAAGAALEREAAVLRSLQPPPGKPPRTPFAIPAVVSSVDLDGGGRAVVLPRPPGAPLDLASVVAGPGLSVAIGRAIAAIHDLPPSWLEDSGVPVHTAAEYRDRRLAELDRAAGTGLVPSRLLSRWEQGLEDVSAWRFAPTVVHGDLSADQLLVEGDTVTAVLGWSEARVADPADDLAWLAAAAPQDLWDWTLAAYTNARKGPRDPYVGVRARLVGELALAAWLLHGVSTDDQDVVDDAHRMLVDLETATPPGAP